MAHFGRFGLFAEALWTLFGLIPAILSLTGVFLCCRRMIYEVSLPARKTQPHALALEKIAISIDSNSNI